MSDQVYEIEAVRKRALDQLRAHGAPMTTGSIALALGVPLWAVDVALESAYLARLATFTAGVGWSVVAEELRAADRVGQGEMDLEGH